MKETYTLVESDTSCTIYLRLANSGEMPEALARFSATATFRDSQLDIYGESSYWVDSFQGELVPGISGFSIWLFNSEGKDFQRFPDDLINSTNSLVSFPIVIEPKMAVRLYAYVTFLVDDTHYFLGEPEWIEDHSPLEVIFTFETELGEKSASSPIHCEEIN